MAKIDVVLQELRDFKDEQKRMFERFNEQNKEDHDSIKTGLTNHEIKITHNTEFKNKIIGALIVISASVFGLAIKAFWGGI